jgi:hypothetical protein
MRRGVDGALFGAELALLLAGCSQAYHYPPPLGDFDAAEDYGVQPPPEADAAAEASGDAPPDVPVCILADAGPDGPPCTNLTNCGQRVDVVDVATDPPTPGGGTVVDGIYVMTRYEIFTGAGGHAGPTTLWFMETSQLMQGTFGVASDNGTVGPNWSSGTYTLPDASATIAYAYGCPMSDMKVFGYTAAPSQLMLQVMPPDVPARVTYAKQ